MKIIIECEESQTVCKAFRAKGHEAYSCDLKPCSGGRPEWHIKGDCLDNLDGYGFIGAHPVCKYLTNSGVGWLVRTKGASGFTWDNNYNIFINWERHGLMVKGALFFNRLLSAIKRAGKGYAENPVMHKYAREIVTAPYQQIIQPYQFGHMESKATCLWLEGLPLLKSTNNVYDLMMQQPKNVRMRLHYLPPSKNRDELRSKTYTGIAAAMAEQWGGL